jgi:hypothetical protein
MARHEQDREDLIAEARALVQRAELKLPEVPEVIVLGFRASGAASLYVGGDEAWHWNDRGQLRRVFLHGVLFRAHHGRLIGLTRQRTPQAVRLVAQPVEPDAEEALLTRVLLWRARLRVARETGTLAVLRQVPADWDVPGAVDRFLATHRACEVASRPHVA